MERLRLVKRLDEELRLGLHETLVLGEGRYGYHDEASQVVQARVDFTKKVETHVQN